jgi:hypothetical protein
MDPMVWVIFALVCLLIVMRAASGRRANPMDPITLLTILWMAGRDDEP